MKSILKILSFVLFTTVVFLTNPVSAQPKSSLLILKNHSIGSNGGWDYVTVDADGKKIYVLHCTQVKYF